MPPSRPLRIAWLGGGPAESGGAPGVVAELLDGLCRCGHEIDLFQPGTPRNVPERLLNHPNLTFVAGTSRWRWDRWYSRTKLTTFVSSLLARGLGALRQRRAILRRHAQRPYDLVFQNQTIESLGAPARLLRSVPLVVRPDTHQAGELRWLIAERRLAFRSQPVHVFFLVAVVMAFRTLVQRLRIRRASLLICISEVFREHLVHDYKFPRERTIVVANPVRLERFAVSERLPSRPARVLVPMRISLRKGLDDVIAVARLLASRSDIQFRVIGGPSMWSDYSKLLDDLPPQNSEYAGRVPPQQMAAELAQSDIVLVASKYEPFGLTAAEALAAGVPVVATSEVGAVERVDRQVVGVVAPGDVAALAEALTQLLDRLAQQPQRLRLLARAEAERLFATDVVCGEISAALERLVAAREARRSG